MLRSYMSHGDMDDEGNLSEEAKAHRAHIDRKGIKHVLEYEKWSGRYPKEMSHHNKGFDIESRDANGKIARYIEVKSMSGAWDGFGIGMSAPQFQMAQDKKEMYWLYVVEEVDKSEAKLHAIQDPASKVVQFRFDDGWRLIADTTTPPARSSLRDVIKSRLGLNENIDSNIPEENSTEC
jgi:hypothetical protein